MSTRPYYMDDAVIAVPAGFVDHTMNVLEWSVEGGDRVALVVQREPLPPGGPDDADPFGRHVARQLKVYPSRFEGYHLERDESTAGDSAGGGGFDMRRVLFRWRQGDEVLYHHQVFVRLGAAVLVLTASAKARNRELVDELVLGALSALEVRAEDLAR